MIKLINIHISYLFTKYPKIIYIISLILLIIAIVFSIPLSISKSNINLYYNDYLLTFYLNAYFYIRLINIILFSYLSGHMFYNEFKQYDVYFISKNLSRIKWFFSKYLSLIILAIFNVLLSYCVVYLVGYIRFDFFKFSLNDYSYFLYIILEIIFIINISILLISFLKTYLSSLIVVFMFLIWNIFSDNISILELSIYTKIMHYIFPIVVYDSKYLFVFGLFHMILIIIIYSSFNTYIAYKKNYY